MLYLEVVKVYSLQHSMRPDYSDNIPYSIERNSYSLSEKEMLIKIKLINNFEYYIENSCSISELFFVSNKVLYNWYFLQAFIFRHFRTPHDSDK